MSRLGDNIYGKTLQEVLLPFCSYSLPIAYKLEDLAGKRGFRVGEAK